MLNAAPIGGKVVVVTGAARGIGRELARQLAARGARLALVGLEPDRLAEVAAECGPNAAWWEADVTDQARLTGVAAEVVERFARVDVLVGNAGIAIGGTLLTAAAADYDRVIEVNLLGSVRTARAFLPHVSAAHGYWLQIASLAAATPMPLISAYCASKAGVEAFTQSVRIELAHRGVDAGVGYLAFTDTDMVRGAEVGRGGSARSRLPAPLGTTHPLPPARARLVAGIERRAPRVYGQAWIRYVLPARALVPALDHLAARGRVAAVEAAQAGSETSAPVGPGGRADTASRDRAGGRTS